MPRWVLLVLALSSCDGDDSWSASIQHTGFSGGGAPRVGAAIEFAGIAVAVTDRTGYYSTVAAPEPPFLVRAVGGYLDVNRNGLQDADEPTEAQPYESFVASRGQAANVTPLTTMVVRTAMEFAASRDPAAVAPWVGAAHDRVRDALRVTDDLLRAPFACDGTGIDGVMDRTRLLILPDETLLVDLEGRVILRDR